MGTYYGVNAVIMNGECATMIRGQSQVPKGKRLVAIVCNGIWSIAPDVTDRREYDEFHNSYCAGNWLSFKVYTINEEDIDKYPDEGRVPCGYRQQN